MTPFVPETHVNVEHNIKMTNQTYTEKKNQHFVPKLLLRGFSVPNTRKKAVSVFDADNAKIIPQASISGQCAHSFLYGEDGIVEDSLCALEGLASTVIKNAIENHSIPTPGTKEWVNLTRFIAVQYSRTPAAGRELNQQRNAVLAQLKESAASKGYEFPLSNIAPADLTLKKPELENLKLLDQFTPVIADLDDLLIINDTEIEFTTSDIGVVLYNKWAESARGMGATGFASRGIQFIMPISSRHTIVKYDSGIYRVRNAKNNSIRITEPSEIKALNNLQIVFAERNTYFTGDTITGNSLAKLSLSSPRSTRSSLVRSHRLVDDAGKHELFHIYSERPNVAFNSPWMPIRKSFASVPTQDRTHQWRPAAMQVFRSLRGESDAPDPELHGMTFRRA